MADWKIQKVSISKLEIFFQEKMLLSQSVLPISPSRVKSYCNNPRAKSDDVSLYFIEFENRIIAFRTVWADEIQLDEELVRFGWCSGNWVADDFRRRGLSTLILQEMYSDWNGKLMFTNYAPESLAGYLKTGLFTLQCERTGMRFYLNTNLAKLYANRANSGLKKAAVWLANKTFFSSYLIKRMIFKSQPMDHFKIDEQRQFSAGYSFVGKASLFNRGEKEFAWIFNCPWLVKDDGVPSSYPFSWKVKDFEYCFVSINSQHAECSFVISIKNGTVKLLYWHATVEHHELIAKWLVNFSHRNKVKLLTVLDDQMAGAIKRIRNPFVWSRTFSMNIYSTFSFEDNKNKVFDGDGDYIFT